MADHAAAARRAAARAPVRTGVVGAGGGAVPRRRARPLVRALDRVMSATTDKPAPQSAAAPSPFPPIADYAFLSNCHTAALIAADGAVDWLCVPSFDAPSAFGSLLDREAGFFRLGPFGITHPTARTYEPGTNVLVTTWKTPSGLDRRPRRADDGADRPRGRDHAAHASAGRRRRRPHARPRRRVPRRPGRARARLRAGVRLRPHAGGVDAGRRRPPRGRRERGGADDPSRLQPAARDRRQPRAGTARARAGRQGVLRALVGRAAGGPGRHRRGRGRHRRDHSLLARLAERGADPRPPLARPDPALGARDQGPDLHADRRDGRRRDDLAARDAGRRAQLGLPLHLDARHDVHAAGAALAEPRLGGRRVHAVRRRPRAERGRLAADHVRDRRPQGPDRVDARRPLRLRRRPSGPARQRGVRPAPERRLRRRARLDPAAHAKERAAAAAPLADRPGPGRVRHEGLGAARPGNLGGARQAAALRLVEADVLGRARPGGAAGRDPRRPAAAGDVGARPPRRSARTSSPTA